MRIAPWKLGIAAALVLALLTLSLPTGTDLGWAYLSQRDYATARELFTQGLRRDPTNPETWIGLAAAFEALGDPDRQIEALEIAARRFPHRQEVLLLRLADVYEANRDPDGAIRSMERLTAKPDPDDLHLLQRLLKLYGWVGRYEEELKVLRKLLVLRPTDPRVVEDLVAVARILNRQEEAIAVVEAFAERRPDDPEAQRRLAEMYDSVGETTRAVDRWRVVARLLPDDLAARNRLLPPPGGSPLLEEIARLELARGADPRDEASRRRLVAIYRQLADAPRAIPVQRELVALLPQSHDDLVTLGRLLVQEDRARDAIAFYERAAQAAPDRVDTALSIAQLYEWANQPQRALAALDRAAGAHPADRALAERVAALAEASGDMDRALATLERLAMQVPQEPKYARRSVELLVGANRLPDAITRQRRLVEREPGAPGPVLRLAQLYEWSGQEPEAIVLYERLDRAGTLADAGLARLSELYRFQNRPAEFLRLAERLLARRPDDGPLREAAVEAADGLGRSQDAFRLLRPVIDRRALDESLALRYLTLAIKAGNPEEGFRVHRRFLASTDPAYRVKAARLLTDLGRHPDAIAEYEAVLAAGAAAGEPADSSMTIQARLALAQLYDWTGAGEPALRQWESLMRARPRDPQVLREVGRRSMGLSRNDVALRAYRSLLDLQPDDAEALKRAGQLMAWGHDSRGAKVALERFNRVKGGDYEVHYLLGELYTADRDEGRARAEYERALRLLPARSAVR
jgi:tetratricopeptide (TPR) repeat protein